MAFVTGSTPFGLFDTDTQFQTDADKIVNWVNKKLGVSSICVELEDTDIYASFEEAVIEYSSYINQYQFKSVAASLLGSPTGSLDGNQNKYPANTLEMIKRQAEPYGDMAGVGGNFTLHSGSFTTTVGMQNYDLQSIMSASFTGSNGQAVKVQIKEIFHLNPTTGYRFFGTTSAVNYLNNQFSFESFTPETIFYMLPVWEDILRGMQFETSNRVRRSNYSYDINNNVVKLYPTPTSATQVYFTYWMPKDPYAATADHQLHGVANISNAPFGNIQYSKVNSLSKQWIWKMTMALAKEILGQIRSKYATIPIPNADVTLNGPELINDAKIEQDRLRAELKEMLEDTTYQRIAAREAEVADNINKVVSRSPLLIYVG